MRRPSLQIGSRLSWIVGWLLAAAAIAVTVLWGPTVWTWWVGLVLLLALVALTVWRENRTGSAGQYTGTGDAGPWGPPPSL